MPADAEPGAEIASQRADIGAARTDNGHIQVQHAVAGPNRQQLETRYRHRPGRQLDLLTAADPGVGSPPGYLDRADRGRDLLDIAGQPSHTGSDGGIRGRA